MMYWNTIIIIYTIIFCCNHRCLFPAEFLLRRIFFFVAEFGKFQSAHNPPSQIIHAEILWMIRLNLAMIAALMHHLYHVITIFTCHTTWRSSFLIIACKKMSFMIVGRMKSPKWMSIHHCFMCLKFPCLEYFVYLLIFWENNDAKDNIWNHSAEFAEFVGKSNATTESRICKSFWEGIAKSEKDIYVSYVKVLWVFDEVHNQMQREN